MKNVVNMEDVFLRNPFIEIFFVPLLCKWRETVAKLIKNIWGTSLTFWRGFYLKSFYNYLLLIIHFRPLPFQLQSSHLHYEISRITLRSSQTLLIFAEVSKILWPKLNSWLVLARTKNTWCLKIIQKLLLSAH